MNWHKGMTRPTLNRKARAAALARGHSMTPLRGDRFWGASKVFAQCRDCGAGLTVAYNPAPNETNIMGEAVALNCPGGTA